MADYNYKSYVKENNLVVDTWEPPSVASIYDDVLKFSDCTNVTVTNISVSGGKEDCIDAVRGSNYLFENLNLYPLNNGITIKGSIDGWHLKNILFSRRGEEYTIEIGQFDNYWYPGGAHLREMELLKISELFLAIRLTFAFGMVKFQKC